MEGIELPLLTEDFPADPVELFFDLTYVFAFSQLVSLLIHEPTWAGAGKAALLFACYGCRDSSWSRRQTRYRETGGPFASCFSSPRW